MSKRTKFLLGIGVIAALVLGFQIVAYATVATDSGFESDDGNLAPAAPINFDWNSFAPVSWNIGTAPYRQADDLVSGWTFKGIEDDQVSNADTAFNGGVKQDDACAATKGAKAPNKDDMKRIYLSTKVVNGDTFLNLAWVRIPQNTTSASAHIAFEFNQSEIPCDPPSSGLVQRTAGDMLIVYDFEGGSDEPVITLRRWVTSGACEVGSSTAPCWGPATNLTAGGFADAAVNTGNTVQDLLTPPNPPATTSVSSTLGLSEFGEAGINLTDAGVFGANTCASFGSVFAVSRSSGNSGTAQMKDLVGPADFNLQNCGSVTIIKQTNPRGLNQAFSFTSTLAGPQMTCTADTTPVGFTLNDTGNAGKTLGSPDAAQNSAGNTESCVNVPVGSYTVTEGADPTGFTFGSVTCTNANGNTTSTVGKVATINVVGSGTTTCVYINLENKQTTLNTAQSLIPNDTATITGTGLTFTGTVDFRLRKGTPPTPANCGTVNDTNPVVYQELDKAVSVTAPHTASTNNLGGDPTTPSLTDGYSILEGASEGAYYWEVTYDGPAGGDPDVTSCTEVSTGTIDNGSGVSNPPATP